MPAARLSHFPCFPADLLLSDSWLALDPACRAYYWSLICHMYMSEDGTISSDPATLVARAGAPDFESIQPVIDLLKRVDVAPLKPSLSHGSSHPSEECEFRYTHARVQTEILRMRLVRERLENAGRKGGLSTSNKKRKQASLKHGSSKQQSQPKAALDSRAEQSRGGIPSESPPLKSPPGPPRLQGADPGAPVDLDGPPPPPPKGKLVLRDMPDGTLQALRDGKVVA